MRARDIMTTDVITLTPDNSVRHAAQIMLDHRISGLPVVDDTGDLAGMLTEGDLLRRAELGSERWTSPPGAPVQALEYIKSHTWKVGDLMTANVVTVDEDTPVSRIATLMEEQQIKRLPVTQKGKLVGIVSRADLLRAIAAVGPEATIEGDEAIRRAILARLGDVEELKDLRLGVIVSNGVVHLWGDVDTEPARRAACMVAENIHGVTGVADHLGVVGSRAASSVDSGVAQGRAPTTGT